MFLYVVFVCLSIFDVSSEIVIRLESFDGMNDSIVLNTCILNSYKFTYITHFDYHYQFAIDA